MTDLSLTLHHMRYLQHRSLLEATEPTAP